MATYFLWALLLVLQNAAFTWVSRARNSGSDWYHATAAVFSNGIWFAVQFITFAAITEVLRTKDWRQGISLGLIYIVATVFGSVFAAKFLRTHIERGARRVGHYRESVK
jgi:hypothetical protein